MFNRLHAISIAVLCSSMSSVSAKMVLRQIHVVSRQGSPTTIIDGDQNYPVQALSAVGESQMYQLGDWIRNAFREEPALTDDDVSFQTPEGLVDQYIPTRVRLEASSLDTAIVSAQAMARGLFPEAPHGIPVFTQSERNDITIAAGDQCPAFQNDLDILYMTENGDWQQMEEAYMVLLQQLAKIDILSAYAKGDGEDRYVPLHNVWKVYDLIREAKLTCTQGFDSTDMANCNRLAFPNAAALLNAMEWDDLKTLAHYAEVQSKYGTERAGRLLGGNLLRQIADRMVDDEMSTPTDTSTKRVFVTSADYPTLIALMTALKVVPEDEQLDEAFPGYGSALVFELYQDDTSFDHAVRVSYKKAGHAKPSVLRLGDFCYEKDLCEMTSFEALLNSLLLGTDAWCQTCGNDTSDLCLFYSRLYYQEALKEQVAKEQIFIQNITESENPAQTVLAIAGTNACPDGKSLREGFAAVFFGGIALGMVVTCMCILAFQCLRKERRGKAKRRGSLAEIDTKMDNEKAFPTTPKTMISTSPMSFFPSYWTNSPEEGTPYNKDLDADALSLVDEDEDHSSHGHFDMAEVAKSPIRKPTTKGMHKRNQSVPTPTKFLSKQIFPPEIV